MIRTLEYRIVQTHDGKPLVTLDSPMGNGQEIRPDNLRALARALLAIAQEADTKPMGRGYRPTKGSTKY